MDLKYISDPSALCGAERFTFTDGKAKGVDAVRLYNGRIDLTVILDRCMDIFRLFGKGMPISYISKNSLVSPKLTETVPYSFLNSFDGGFLYTCGLDNIGAPAEKNGRMLPQHGSISYIPAENVRVETYEANGEYGVTLKGTMKFTALFGQKLVMNRSITLKYMCDEIELRDTIVNEGYTDEGYMLMYHCNIGYPLLNERAKLWIDSDEATKFSENADLSHWSVFESPTPAKPEEVFIHKLRPDCGVKACLESGDMRMNLDLSASDFPYLTQWKSMACGDYVLGIEPATTAMSDKQQKILPSGKSDTYTAVWRFEEIKGC